MDTMRRGRWQFWAGWGLAFVGFPIGGVAASALVGPVETVGEAALAGAVTGAAVGAAEWLALRRRLPVSPWWVAATSAGMAGGLAVSTALLGSETADATLLWRGLITGAGVGIAQVLLLRRATSRAWAWGPVVAVGWAVGWAVTRAIGVDMAPKWSVFGSAGALTFQLLTGLTLAWLLQGRADAPADQSALPADRGGEPEAGPPIAP
jgi:hypothetical protein